MARKRLSAIEYTVLGIAWKRGPCTTYALMKELASSTSTYYKARAGTAYPLVERLVQQNLLTHADDVGPKGEKLIAVTDAGLAALKHWLTAPLEFSEVAHTVDFVRLRVFYLGAATPGERRALIDDAVAELGEHLRACEGAMARYQTIADVFSTLATQGVVQETKARIKWLTDIRELAVDVGGEPK
ncbi:MAG: PadR family transcriptional regulator [Fimbriimonadaceae bacterium]